MATIEAEGMATPVGTSDEPEPETVEEAADFTSLYVAMYRILLLITLFSAALVQISIIVAASCAAFWIVDSYPVLGLAWKLREFSPYPMSIFDGAFRFAFTYVIPIGFVAFYPSQLFLRPEEVSPIVYFSPIIGIGLFAITYWIWTKGVNSYTGTGS